MKQLIPLLICLPLLITCSKSNKDKNIAIQPYGLFSGELTDSVSKSIERTYGFKVEILASKDIPKRAFVNVKSPRYRADSIIRILRREMSPKFDHILGLTSFDISTTKKDPSGKVLEPGYKYNDWGIFGLGFRPGESCVVSTYRLNTSDRNLLIERLKKVCNHELGHNLGLPHCESDDKCVMKDGAESIKTVDHVNLVLCNTCAAQVH